MASDGQYHGKFLEANIHSHFGLKISGISVCNASESEIQSLRLKLSQNGLLHLPKQSLSDEELYIFCQRIGNGQLGETARKISQTSSFKYINNLSNLLDSSGNNIGHPGQTTDYWHSDQEFRLNPATLGILYCVMPSEEGGETSFASTCLDHLDLEHTIIPDFHGLETVYRPARTHDNVLHQDVIHPFILTAPSRKRFFYLSENTIHIRGLSEMDSENLKKLLLASITRRENIYHHNWKLGDLLVYDNCQLIHRRTAYAGNRWLKSAKIFAPVSLFAIPYGKATSTDSPQSSVKLSSTTDPIGPTKEKKDVMSIQFGRQEKIIQQVIQSSFHRYVNSKSLKVPKPIYIRAGQHGGLPFESLTTDLSLGCLPPQKICYGNCFAARAAFEAGFDFGKRVDNILDDDIFSRDLTYLDQQQLYLRNGWNSDPSWSWSKALRLSSLIHNSNRHTIFITKAFLIPPKDIMEQLGDLNVEIRVSVSALDTKQQLKQRINFIEEYRRCGGTSIPLILTAKFKERELTEKQNSIVEYLIDQDLPCAENSLRINPASSLLQLLDTKSMRPLLNGDLWAGRLYARQNIKVPTTTSIPPTYRGLQSSYLSMNDDQFLDSLWHEPVHSNLDVISDKKNCHKPTKCGVPMNWKNCENSAAGTDQVTSLQTTKQNQIAEIYP